jgi:methyl-CpG-binding domain protein 4
MMLFSHVILIDWLHYFVTFYRYAADAYAIFCSGRWQEVMPTNQKLELYWKFLNKGGGQKQ